MSPRLEAMAKPLLRLLSTTEAFPLLRNSFVFNSPCMHGGADEAMAASLLNPVAAVNSAVCAGNTRKQSRNTSTAGDFIQPCQNLHFLAAVLRYS